MKIWIYSVAKGKLAAIQFHLCDPHGKLARSFSPKKRDGFVSFLAAIIGTCKNHHVFHIKKKDTLCILLFLVGMENTI